MHRLRTGIRHVHPSNQCSSLARVRKHNTKLVQRAGYAYNSGDAGLRVIRGAVVPHGQSALTGALHPAVALYAPLRRCLAAPEFEGNATR